MSDEQRKARATEAEDAELVAKSRAGDQQAFALLWRRHHNRALTAARTLARTEADDIVSEAFAVIWEQLQRGRGPRSGFRPYLLATVRNLAARSYKRNLRVVTLPEVDEASVDETHDPVEREEIVRTTVIVLRQLPLRWQQVLLLALVQKIPRADIASKLKMSPNSTSQLLRRAKEGFRIAWLRQRVSLDGECVQRHVVESLPRYVRGGWKGQKQVAIRRHLAHCLNCRIIVDELCRENVGLAAVSLTLAPIIVLAAVRGLFMDGYSSLGT